MIGLSNEPVAGDSVRSLRLGIIGTKNTHAYPMVGFLNGWSRDIPIPDHSHTGTPLPDMHLWARTLRELEQDPLFRAQFGGTRVARIWSEDRSDGDRVAQAGETMVSDTPEEVLENVDAVMILTEDPQSHEDLGLAALERRVPTFIDKPMAPDPTSAGRLFAVADKLGVPCWSGSSMRLTKAVLDLRSELDAGPAAPRHLYVQCPIDIELYAIHGFSVVGSLFGFSGMVELAVTDAGERQLIAITYDDGRTAVVDMLNELTRSVFTIVGYTDVRQHIVTYSSDGRSLLALLKGLLWFFGGGSEPYPRGDVLAELELVQSTKEALNTGGPVSLQ